MPSWPAKSLGRHRHIKEQVRERDAKAQEQEGMPPNNPPPATTPPDLTKPAQCPGCGMELDDYDHECVVYECDSVDYYNGEFEESPECKDRQIGKLKAQLYALTEELAALKSAARWIPVGERLPEKPFDVLAWNGESHLAYYTIGQWRNAAGALYGERLCAVTAWRPLPEGPEGE